MGHAISRRGFLTAAAGAAVASRSTASAAGPTVLVAGGERPALLGGAPVRTAKFPAWPVVDEREEKALQGVLHGGKWYRGDGKTVSRFEEAYARLTGARHCIATANGTSALYASLAALDVSPGDEVILPPYTFVASLNVVFLQYALPVFVDTDPETFQMEENARYLTQQLREINGILPARMHEGCTRNAYHLYMFRYRKEAFAELPRERFLAALRAEGVPCSGGYTPLDKEPFVKATLASRGYRKVFPPETLAAWEERNRCPANDRLCEQAVWLTQTMLLGPRRDMDDVAAAIRKIQASAAELAKA